MVVRNIDGRSSVCVRRDSRQDAYCTTINGEKRNSFVLSWVVVILTFASLWGNAAPALGDASSPAILIAGIRGGSGRPSYQVLTGSTFGSSQNLPEALGQCPWIRAANDPTRNQTIGVFMDEALMLQTSVFDGSTWTTPVLLTSAAGDNAQRRTFDLHVGNSGLFLVVYWDSNQTSGLRFRTISGNGGATTFDGTVATLPASQIGSPSVQARWIALAGRPCEDRAVLTLVDSDGRIFAAIWSGSSFGSLTQLTASASTTLYECFAGAIEGVSGDPLVVYAKSDGSVVSRTFSSGAWQAEQTVAWPGSSLVNWLRLTTRSTDNTVLGAGHDAAGNIGFNRWDGTQWQASGEQLATGLTNAARPQFDIEFTPDGSSATLLYNQSGVGTVYYKNFSGTTWSAEMTSSGGSQIWAAGGLFHGASGASLWALWVPAGSRFFTTGFSGASVSAGLVQQAGLLMGGQATLPFDLVVPRSVVTPCPVASKPKLTKWETASPR